MVEQTRKHARALTDNECAVIAAVLKQRAAKLNKQALRLLQTPVKPVDDEDTAYTTHSAWISRADALEDEARHLTNLANFVLHNKVVAFCDIILPEQL